MGIYTGEVCRAMLPQEIPNYYCIVGEDWTVLEVGKDLAALQGREPDEMVGRDAWEFAAMPPGRLRSYFTGMLSRDGFTEGEVDILHEDGGTIPFAYVTYRARWEGRAVYVSIGVPLSVAAAAVRNRFFTLASRIEEVLERTMEDRYYSVAKATDYTSFSDETLSKWADDGVIRRYGTRAKITYKRSELDRAMRLAWE